MEKTTKSLDEENQLNHANEFDRIPKVENHLHMEGAIPLETLWKLIQKYGGDPSVKDIHQLKEKFNYRDFNHFIEMWIWKNKFIREYEDFTLIADDVLKDLKRQNIKYAEIFISPSGFRGIMETQKIVEAISNGISKNTDIGVNLIVDLVRNFGPDAEIKTLYEINEVKNYGIIGIGIGGIEQGYPPELFIKLYEQARKFGFKTTAHAGEAAGAESIWGAVHNLQVDRIGHGTKAIEDTKLLEYLAEKQIPVELCPLSNLKTRVIHAIEEHPIQTFLQMGIPVSINTDDPKMFGNSLAEEYQVLKNSFGFSDAFIYDLIIRSVSTMWLTDQEKADLEEKIKLEMNVTK